MKIFNQDNKLFITISLLLLINFIFAYKYIERVTHFSLAISIVISVMQYASLSIKVSAQTLKLISKAFIGLCVVLVFFSWYKISLHSLNVDRFSVISSFWNELLKGNYPYFAKSHQGNYPGPMPVYFLVCFPFYWIGELGILSALGYVLFIRFITKRQKKVNPTAFIPFYFITALFLYWEIMTRSNIFTFSVLILFFLIEFESLISFNVKKLISIGFLTGLLMSTRNVYILVFIIFFLSSFLSKRLSIKQLLILSITALISFALTFLPLIIMFKNDFLVQNPFIIQSSVLVPVYYSIAFVFIAFTLSFLVKNSDDRFYFSGIALFLSILLYAFFRIKEDGFYSAFHENRIDISYFILCIPFLVYYLFIKIDNNSYTAKS